MTLEDFEKQLAADKEAEKGHRSSRTEDDQSRRRHHHHRRHGHRSHRDPSRDRQSRYDEDGHRSKRSKRSDDEDDRSERRHRRKHRSKDGDDQEDVDVAKQEKPVASEEAQLKRDSWMEDPSALDIDYVQRRRTESSPPKNEDLAQKFELKVHKNELNHHLHDLQQGKTLDDIADEPAQSEVNYAFGDSGSKWRMTKLKAVYRQAEESGRKVEEIALERYGNLRDFDDAREEETELERRSTYGKGYVGKEKPSGDLFQQRKLDAGIRRPSPSGQHADSLGEHMMEQVSVPTTDSAATKAVDKSTLNKMKAQALRAKMMKAPNANSLQAAYEVALAESESTQQSETITLSAMDSRMLAGPRNEAMASTGRRNLERGNVEENEDMTIADMVAEERRTKNQAGGEGQRLAERIAKDGKFTNDLEYLDENASKLAKRVHKSEINLRNTAIGDFTKLNKILDACPLCFKDSSTPPQPPTAPVVSLATRTYLTLPTLPHLSPTNLSAVITPLNHHPNLLHCDVDEWDELRNFMKSLTRMYHDLGLSVIFYENAAFPSRHPHAALTAIPLPYDLGDTAPAFFKEAFLASESEWSQHKKIIDTLAASKQAGMGKMAFRRSLVKEMPYFHVWFTLDGGYGHVVEDAARWPRGDLFAREVVGGMLGVEGEVVKRQGRWGGGEGSKEMVEGFRKRWRRFDWTRVLTDAAQQPR